MNKKLATISTARLDTTTGGFGFGGGWAASHPYRAERYLENHPRYEQRWSAYHPYAAARLGRFAGC
jgi:hypothetical protein